MLLLRDVEELVLVHRGGWSFSLQLKDHHTGVVAGSKEVDLRMSRNDPESIQVPFERLNRGPLIQIPHSDRLVFSNREYKILVRVEETGGCVLEMTTTRIDLPRFGVCALLDQSKG